MPLSSDMMSAPIGDDTTVTSDDAATMPLFDDTIQTEPDIQPVEPKQEKARKSAGRRPYSYDKIRGQVIAFYRRNGRMPKREDIEYDLSFPSWGTIYKYLGRQSEWEKLIPPSLLEPANPNDDASPVEADITTAGENDTTPNDGAFVTESEVVDSTSSEQSQDDVVITTQHHWEEQILHVEISISKPGVSTPIRITISV